MKNIYIDTNVYLLFYFQKESKFNDLLESLVELKDKIFIPKQIVYEVERNKLKRFSDSFNEYIKKATEVDNITIPTHFDSSSEKRLEDWNQERKKIYNNLKDSNTKLRSIKNDLYVNIYNGADEVSIKLKKIFDLAKDAEPAMLEKARLRKERGNPPGKKTDTLGDQISWEQFLQNIAIEVIDEVWIITKDSDYFIKDNNNKIHINSLLREELKELGIKNIQIHDDISKAIKEYNKAYTIKNIPTELELDKFIKFEEDMNPNYTWIWETPSEHTSLRFMEIDPFSRLIGYCTNCKQKRTIRIKENYMKAPDYYCSECGTYLYTPHGF